MITATVCSASSRSSTLAMLASWTGVAPVTLIRPLGVAVHAQARSSPPSRSRTHSEYVPFNGMLLPFTASSVPQFFRARSTLKRRPLSAWTE